MDNAIFHKVAETKELIETAGCNVLYLPKYSPDLNPIEHCWHMIKSWLRSRMHQHKDTDPQPLIGKGIIKVYHLVKKIL